MHPRPPLALLVARARCQTTPERNQHLKGEGKRRGGEIWGHFKGLNDRTELEADGRLPWPPRGAAPPPSPPRQHRQPPLHHPPSRCCRRRRSHRPPPPLPGRLGRKGSPAPTAAVPGPRPSLCGRREAAPAMGDIHEVPRPRIATAQLAQHIGQPVCFVGRVEKVRGALGGLRERGRGCPGLCGERLAPSLGQPGGSGRPGSGAGGGRGSAGKTCLRRPRLWRSRPPLERTGLFSRIKYSFVDSFQREARRAYGWTRKAHDCGAERACKLRSALEILDAASCGFRRFCLFWNPYMPSMFWVIPPVFHCLFLASFR